MHSQLPRLLVSSLFFNFYTRLLAAASRPTSKCIPEVWSYVQLLESTQTSRPPLPIFLQGAGGKKCDFWPYRSTALDFVPLWFGKQQDIVTIFNCLCSNDLTMSPPSLVQIFPRLLKITPGSFGAPPITDEKSVVNRQ